MTYGVPIEAFPISDDGIMDYKAHSAWIEMRKQIERDPSKALTLISAPTQRDALLGRGKGTQLHPGNVRLRTTMESFFDEYEQCKRDEKKAIAAAVIAAVGNYGGRFLQQRDGVWEEVHDKNVLLKKVMHGFRDLRRVKLNINGNNDSSTAKKRPLKS